MNDENELLSCPFCGGDGYSVNECDSEYEYWGIVCEDCHARSHDEYDNERQAREAWNMRAS
ncbi:MAG: Lar family restriction alleviation protein [Candidatus Thiodiazotropha lotti]